MTLLDRGKGVVGQLIVVSIISKSRRSLGEISKVGFILLVKECVLSCNAFGNWLEVLSKAQCGYEKEEEAAEAHGARKSIRGKESLSESAPDESGQHHCFRCLGSAS